MAAPGAGLKRKFDQISRCETKASEKVHRVQQQWRLENFDLIHKRYIVGQKLFSDPFGDANGGPFSWRVWLHPCGRREEVKDHVGIFLQNVSAPSDAVMGVTFKILMLNKDGKVLFEKLRTDDFDVGQSKGYNKCWLYSPADENSVLTIVTELEFAEKQLEVETRTATTTMAASVDEMESTGKVLGAIKRLRKNEQLCDFAIVVVNENETRKFAVHRAILAARSPVFAAMFDGVWSEQKDGSIDLAGVSIEAVDAMLDFVYTGKCEGVDAFSDDLLNLAEKYQVEELKALCEAHLVASVDVESVFDMYCVANMFGLRMLDEACLELFCENEAHIIDGERWAMLKKQQPEVAFELLEFAAKAAR